MSKYSVIIIGGGHNGLVAATYLAKAGHKVLVLDRHTQLGGIARTETLAEQYRIDTLVHDAGTFRPHIVKDLNLVQHGLELIQPDAAFFAPLSDGRQLTLWRDLHKTTVEVAHFSNKDADVFDDYGEQLDAFADVLEDAWGHVPPDLKALGATTAWSWLGTGQKFRKLGNAGMMELLRILPMPVKDFLEDWFESEELKGVLGAAGIFAGAHGPYAPGTTYNLLHHHLGHRILGVPASLFFKGGMGRLGKALSIAARAAGAEIKNNTTVQHIIIEKQQAKGVILADGTHITADTIVSSASPHHTFLQLMEPYHLPPNFTRYLVNIKYRGTVAKLNLALTGMPTFADLPNQDTTRLQGRILISPHLNYLEKSADAAKYRTYAKNPMLDIRIPTLTDATLAPEGHHIMSVWVQHAPYRLEGTTWAKAREAFAGNVVQTLTQYIPNLPDLIAHQQVLTPVDLETQYDLPEGNPYHGILSLDQIFVMRPIPGWAQYRTPIKGLYLCGAGTHGGGGLTGVPGQLAAQVILQDVT